MDILTNKNLSNYVTMRIGGPARALVTIHCEQELADAVAYAQNNNLKILTLGLGSNIIFKDAGFDGLVIINKIKGLEINKSGLVTASAGEIWDDIVQKSIEAGFVGIEALTAIPGTAGASPVNNIGAYGQELQETVVSVRAFDTHLKTFVDINNEGCNFSYRDSCFKSKDYGRFIICGIKLQLAKTPKPYSVPNYQSLIDELNNRSINKPTPYDVRQALIAVRNSKLPNPNEFPNAGSFFKNPLVSSQKAKQLKDQFPNLPVYSQKDSDKVKLAAGWLIENCGLKGYRQGGVWVYDKHSLVLVNESSKSFKNLWFMAEHIIKLVDQKFGVLLTPEPEII